MLEELEVDIVRAGLQGEGGGGREVEEVVEVEVVEEEAVGEMAVVVAAASPAGGAASSARAPAAGAPCLPRCSSSSRRASAG